MSDKESNEAESGTPVPQANLGNTVRASWNFSLDDVRAAIAHYSPEAKELLVAAFRWCIDPRHPMSKAEFARRVGGSDTLIYRIYTGKYVNPDTKEQLMPSGQLVSAIRKFLELEQQRYESGRMDFVITPTARKVFTACDLARESQTPVILWGPSHIGKSWALDYYQANNNHGLTFFVELAAACGLGGMVRQIAEGCGISDRSNTTDLIERIKRALTPNTLLILDEVHLLQHTYRINSFFACIEVIRRIYDFSKCGMVLCWTRLENLRRNSQGELQQTWRRGVHKVALPLMPTRADLAAILEHYKLGFPAPDLTVTVQKVTEKPYEVVRLLAKREGLKAITERVRYARKLSVKSGRKLEWAHFIDAHLRIEKASLQEGEWI